MDLFLLWFCIVVLNVFSIVDKIQIGTLERRRSALETEVYGEDN